MSKTILVTGATDGIGLETAKRLALNGHHLLLHGRDEEKLAQAKATLQASVFMYGRCAAVEGYLADLSDLSQVQSMGRAILMEHESIDVLINNAGVFRASSPRSLGGFDIRFVVNTLAPLLLTQLLWPAFSAQSRVINLASAAQASLDFALLCGDRPISDAEAYAQSKLALIMWSRQLGMQYQNDGPVIVAVNPKSMLGSKMVKDAFGIAGLDLSHGADILLRAALSDEFADAGGLYFDNDVEAFVDPHADALNQPLVHQVLTTLAMWLTPYLSEPSP